MKKQRIYNFFLVAGLPFLLVSCFAAKEYEQPEIIKEENFRTDSLPKQHHYG